MSCGSLIRVLPIARFSPKREFPTSPTETSYEMNTEVERHFLLIVQCNVLFLCNTSREFDTLNPTSPTHPPVSFVTHHRNFFGLYGTFFNRKTWVQGHDNRNVTRTITGVTVQRQPEEHSIIRILGNTILYIRHYVGSSKVYTAYKVEHVSSKYFKI